MSTTTTTPTPTQLPPTMLAAVVHSPGGPEALTLSTVPLPTLSNSTPDSLLMHIHAFGLNRSELFTRQGHSPGVLFPRILGIECVGVVVASSSGSASQSSNFPIGAKVATAMGGLGRDFDGGYAQYCVVPAGNCVRIDDDVKLGWEVLGAAPEMLQTAWGSVKALRVSGKGVGGEKKERVLIRGGTTSVGLAAAGMVKRMGCWVGATTRRDTPAARDLLVGAGADEVLVDDGNIAAQVAGKKYDKVLELIGTTTLRDSLKCVNDYGIVCMTGIVGNAWAFTDPFAPMDSIPSTVSLTCYSGGTQDFHNTPLNDFLKQIEAGSMKLQIGKVFRLEELVEAHRCMEENRAGGKIVVLT